jgi:hypothetical protein
MSDILEKMGYQVPGGFLWFNILLPADMTIPALDFSMTIETVPFFTLTQMAQRIFILLKIMKFGRL